MAERKGQRRVRCENQHVYDRLSSQKMSQVYHWLVPEDQAGHESWAKVTTAENEKGRRHLRPSFL
jgi:translation initiation factor IF-1